jgi:hypothetical protein
VKKSSKKTTRKTAKPGRGGSSGNLGILLKAGVIVERERLSDEEKQVIESLTPEEIAALRSVHKKFESRSGRKSPFWRAFCF